MGEPNDPDSHSDSGILEDLWRSWFTQAVWVEVTEDGDDESLVSEARVDGESGGLIVMDIQSGAKVEVGRTTSRYHVGKQWRTPLHCGQGL